MGGRNGEKYPQTFSLFLFGAGYRAMLFHLGALQRLNDFGLLKDLSLISSVSGGSIVAARLAAMWSRLNFDSNNVALNFDELVAAVIPGLASTSVESPWRIAATSLNNFATNPAPLRYKALVGNFLLNELPSKPEFVFKAMNLQTRRVWRFSRNYVGDGLVGGIPAPRLRLATAIAASTCLPPQLPVVLDPASIGDAAEGATQFNTPEFRDRILLCDGSESWKSDFAPTSFNDISLVSDAGAIYPFVRHPRLRWLNSKALDFKDAQPQEDRKREWPDKLGKKRLRRAYWDISQDIMTFGAEKPLECPPERTKELAGVRSGFAAIEIGQQKDLIDLGFASCDSAVRASLDEFAPRFPDASPNGSFYRTRAAVVGPAAAWRVRALQMIRGVSAKEVSRGAQ